MVLFAASYQPDASAQTRAAAAGAPAARGFGSKMHEADDLETNDVQGIARKYRGIGIDILDRFVAAVRTDPRPRVRANAVTVILDACYFGRQLERARPYLLEALADPDPDVLARAGDALAGAYVGDPKVKEALSQHAEALRAATSSSDSIVQAHAVSALEKMGERPPAASMLRSSSSGLRRRGIEQASKAHDLSAAPMLIALARTDPEVVVRMEAIPVAAELAARDVRDQFLGELIADPDDHVGAAAIQAAGATKASALAKKIEAVLAAHGGNRTEAAITAIAALGDSAAAPAIAAHLNDRGTDTKWAAKLALDALVGPPRELPAWQAWAREKQYLP